MLLSKLQYHQIVDSELFHRVKQNDTNAFEELYHRYWPTLVNTAYKKLSSREKAEDIVQNIFIEIYHRRTTIELYISLKAYLNQALKFKILNEYRSNLIKAKYQQHLFLNTIRKNDFANELDAKELEGRIHKTLKELPEKCREVFILSRKENLSNRDISTRLDITVSTVEKHISKALRILKQCRA